MHCLNADAAVTVVCPRSGLNAEVEYRVALEQVQHVDRNFEPDDLSGADMVLLTDRLAALPFARALARRTLRVTHQNLAWAAAYNAVCVPVALAGWLPPWLAGLGMAASSLAVVANALRLAR